MSMECASAPPCAVLNFRLQPARDPVASSAMEIRDSGGAAGDEDVIARIQAGDVDAFEALVEKYRGRVFRIVGGHVPPGRVEEVAQDVFISAYRSLRLYRSQTSFEHWLSRIAVRRCHDFWRSASRHPEVSVERTGAAETAAQNPAEASEAREHFRRQEELGGLRELMEWALAQIQPDDRMVVTLVHLEGYSVAEAADLLAWSVAKVKVRAMRARQKLKQIISRRLEREAKL